MEPLIISFKQAFTKKLLTDRERSFGNRIEFYTKDLIFMSIGQKIEMINLLAPTGALFENEKRAILGLMPLPELEGKRYMSLNWIDAKDASQYQVGKENVEVIDKDDMGVWSIATAQENESRIGEILLTIMNETGYTSGYEKSRNEQILISIINGTQYDKEPESRIEELLLDLKAEFTVSDNVPYW